MDHPPKAKAAAAAAPTTDVNCSISVSAAPQDQGRRVSCTKCFDALWFCYSPFHQIQQYYIYGEFDNCFGKWNALFDCLSLKTKKSSEVQEILDAREKSRPRIWEYRTVEEASVNWWKMYSHFYKFPPKPPDS